MVDLHTYFMLLVEVGGIKFPWVERHCELKKLKRPWLSGNMDRPIVWQWLQTLAVALPFLSVTDTIGRLTFSELPHLAHEESFTGVLQFSPNVAPSLVQGPCCIPSQGLHGGRLWLWTVKYKRMFDAWPYTESSESSMMPRHLDVSFSQVSELK